MATEMILNNIIYMQMWVCALLLRRYPSGTPSLTTGTSPPSCLLLDNHLYTIKRHENRLYMAEYKFWWEIENQFWALKIAVKNIVPINNVNKKTKSINVLSKMVCNLRSYKTSNLFSRDLALVKKNMIKLTSHIQGMVL